MNNSTNITLNDRFSILASVKPAPRARSRSRSRSRARAGSVSRGATSPKIQQGSQRNRNLINKLDQKHQILLAMKLKNKSLRATRRKNLNKPGPVRPLNASQRRRLKRNSLANTTLSVKDRLGTLGARESRGKFRRSQLQQQRGRSRSRGPRGDLSRSNSQSNLRRSNSKSNLRRSNSQSNLKRGNSQQNLAAQRVRLNRNNFRQNGFNNRSLSQSRSGSRQNLSVNNRLGNNRTAPARRNRRGAAGPQSNLPTGGVIRGRIVRRRNNNTKVVAKKVGRGELRNTTRGQQLKSTGNRNQLRGRARGRNNRGGNQPQQQRQGRGQRQGQGQGQGNARRGRSRSRGGRVNRGQNGKQQGGAKKQELTREMLDKQIDEYMQSS